MKNTNSELRTEFKDYLQWNWWNVENLENTIKRFGLDIFDIFLDWIIYMKKHQKSKKESFCLVSNELKQKKYIDYFEDKTYRNLQNLFINFIDFCNNNKEIFNVFFLEKYWSKFWNSQEWKEWQRKFFIEKWHEYIINDKWENKDKFCGYLFDIYEGLGLNDYWKLWKFYTYLFDAHKILTEISSRNKEIEEWKLIWKKQSAFNIAFDYLCKKLSELNISDQEWRVKSIFGKYLNFTPKYREKLGETLSQKTDNSDEVKSETKWNIVKNLTQKWAIPWDTSYIWDWFWPVEIVSKDKTWILTRRGDILPPDDWIFGDDIIISPEIYEVEEKPEDKEKIKKPRKKNKEKWDDGQWKLDFEF